MKAIVYTSNTGTTKQYAKLISKETSIPYYSLKEAKSKLEKGSDIIYMGWVMAGTIKGYKTASKNYNVIAVCAVGMSPGNSQIKDIINKNKITTKAPLFILQGGYDIKKLKGIYKFMMKIMSKTVMKSLNNKSNKTQLELDMLEMVKYGKNFVCKENIESIIEWYKSDE